MKPIKIKEYLVETYIDNWDEISIKHKLITKKYLKYLFPKFLALPFVQDVYIAPNKLIRINMIGNDKRFIPIFHKNIPYDICLHYKREKNEVMIMRNEREGYREKEDMIVQIIVESLEEYLEYKKDKK